MDNKTQLQANNERINALTELLKNKTAGGGGSGSSGLDINGLLKQALVKEGTTVFKGDFVSLIESLRTSSSTYTGYGARIIEVTENVYFAVTGYNSNRMFAYVIQCSKNSITTTVKQINSTTNSCYGRPILVKINDTTVFIAHSYSGSWYLYGTVVTIDGTTITVQKTSQLSSASASFYTGAQGYDSLQGTGLLYDTNKVLICVPYGGYYNCYAFRFEIGEDFSITQIGDYLNVVPTYQLIRNCQLVNDSTVLVTSCGASSNASNGQYGGIYKINLEDWTSTVVMNRLPALSGETKRARSYALNETTMLYVTNDTATTFQICLIDIPNQSIIFQTQTNTPFKIEFDIQKIGVDKFAVLGRASTTGGLMILQTKNNTVEVLETYTLKTTIGINGEVGDIVYDENLGAFIYYGSYAMLIYLTPYATPISTNSDTIGGVAKDDGNSGDLIEVFVPNV